MVSRGSGTPVARLSVLALALWSTLAGAAIVNNPACPVEAVKFNPGNGEDIVVPSGYKVSAFVTGLNFPTAVAFVGNAHNFKVYVLESGHGLPSRCNDEANPAFGGVTSPTNPMTPDIVVFDQNGNQIAGPIGKPTSADPIQNTGFQASGPAIHIAFENGFHGGRLFATDSNQATHAANGPNNSSRIATVDLNSGKLTPFITGLPTGDHPAEQIAVSHASSSFLHPRRIRASSGSTTEAARVSRTFRVRTSC